MEGSEPTATSDDSGLRRAYRMFLGNAYEQRLMDHIELSSIAQAYGPDFQSAWKWQLSSVAVAMETMPPRMYQPMLITDKGSAWIPLEMHHGAWFKVDGALSSKIARFVADLGATYVIYTYAQSSSKSESFILIGTDGLTAREAHWLVEYKRRGKREIHPMARVEGRHYTSHQAMPPGSDPTAEISPWSDGFALSDAGFEVRELRGST